MFVAENCVMKRRAGLSHFANRELETAIVPALWKQDTCMTFRT